MREAAHIAFDNLAIQQLLPQRFLEEGVWENFYMGDDGRFSLYVDGVTNTHAISSAQPRKANEGRTIVELFRSRQQK